MAATGLGAQPADRDPEAAVRTADEAYHRAARTRDEEAFHALLTADAVFLGSELERGRIDYVASWQPVFEGRFGFRYRGEHRQATVARSGDLAWTMGDVETRFTPPGSDEASVKADRYLTVWSRAADAGGDRGSGWKVAAAGSLVVHRELGAAREPRTGLMTAWPELADQIDAAIEIEWLPEKTVRAASGELAYSFGEYRAQFRNLGVTYAGTGAYVAVWEKDGEGRWQLAAEALTPPAIHSP